jgi:hypothetical protein
MLTHTALAASHPREFPRKCRYRLSVHGGVQTIGLDDAIHKATGGYSVCTVPRRPCLDW